MQFDVLLVGGGLQNGLIAAALRARRPEWRVGLLDQGTLAERSQTWSFPLSDVPPAAASFVEPLVHCRWPRYSVKFPGWQRTLEQPYASILPESFAQVLARCFTNAPGCEIREKTRVVDVSQHSVLLEDGSRLEAKVVLDGRGAIPLSLGEPTGYQKFYGLEVELSKPGPFSEPVLMDACVSQEQGFRFFYVLPFRPDRLLVEETFFSGTAELDGETSRQAVLTYLAEKGCHLKEILREEAGVLRMPWGSITDHSESSKNGATAVGTRGEWFHPATGYSFPVAVKLALAACESPAPEEIPKRLERLRTRQRTNQNYCRFLNRMLFTACDPPRRIGFFKRFYLLPEQMIRRFYSLELNWLDRLWILMHRFPHGLKWTKILPGCESTEAEGSFLPPDSPAAGKQWVTEPAMLVPSDARSPTSGIAQERE